MRTTLGFIFLFFCLKINAYNLPPHLIKSYDCSTCSGLSHDNLTDQWTTSDFPLQSIRSNKQKSYSYTQRITAKQLKQGITLPIQTPGAVLHIMPLDQKTIPSIELKNPEGSFMNLKEASRLYSQDEAMQINLPQTLLQIKPQLGRGNFLLRSKKINSDNADSYLVHVFEKNSSVYLETKPSSFHYQYGDEFSATLTLRDERTTYPMEIISAILRGPENQIIPLEVREIGNHQFQARNMLLSESNTRGGNWYIEVEVISHLDGLFPTRRNGHAAFSYSIPSATLVSVKQIASNPLTLSATVQVATASRYALQGILLRKNDSGVVPVETAQRAQWLEPGNQTMELRFDNPNKFREDQLFVGFLHLIDYGQLKPVYQMDAPLKLSQILD